MILILIIAFIISQIIISWRNNKIIPPTGNILIIDTETTGFPSNWNAKPDDTSVWPRIVTIAWIKIGPNGAIKNQNYKVIKTDGFSIPESASNIHGITNAIANTDGESLAEILSILEEDLKDCNYIVAHNIEFDYPILLCEFKRLKIETKLKSLVQVCTMKLSTDYCKIQTSKGYKYPSLNELNIKLFGTKIAGLHNSKLDAEICLKCFKELFNLGVIKL